MVMLFKGTYNLMVSTFGVESKDNHRSRVRIDGRALLATERDNGDERAHWKQKQNCTVSFGIGLITSYNQEGTILL